MLVKKELEKIPILNTPKIPNKELLRHKYIASAQVCPLKRSGDVLVVDIFNSNARSLKLRFFCDGKTYLWCKSWPATEWFNRKPNNEYGNGFGSNIASTKEDDELVAGFLKHAVPSWHYGCTLERYIDGFASALYSKKREQAAERKYCMREEHFKMFPEYPDDLPAYCERRVFEHTYIFIDKIQKEHRKAVCGHCGRKFKLRKDIAKQGKFGICPKCGTTGKYRGLWINTSPVDRAKICIAHKVDNQLIIRWTDVRRIFFGTKYEYRFDDYYRSLYLHTPKGNIIYSYAFICAMYYGWGWYPKRNGTVNYEKAFIYTDNLRDVFGESYYHVDLESGLTNAKQISFMRLLDNLKNTVTAEYLFKMGLSALAANMQRDDLSKGAGFSEALGVSKQYLPLYRKYNVDIYEHRVIQASNTWVSGESLEKYRALKPEQSDTADIIDILDDMSFERFVNYFTKQRALIKKRKLQYILTLYKDYISMAESLKTDLTRKSIRFPKNIKASHDLILTRFNEVKHEIESENLKQAAGKLYAGMNEYAKGNYRIVFPELRSDFITEGQSLNHCVGSESYFKNHIEGTRMIFFIRQINEPEKPFFTMEIDMRELKIRQLYGFGDCSAPVDVKKFANDFLQRLRPKAELSEVAI